MGRPCSGETKRSAFEAGSTGKTSTAAPASRPSRKRAGQRIEVDHGAARIVDQIGALLHQRDLARADHVGGRRRLRHVQRDHVARPPAVRRASRPARCCRDGACRSGRRRSRACPWLRRGSTVASRYCRSRRCRASCRAPRGCRRPICPSRRHARTTERGKIRRNSITTSAMVSSATLRVLEYGALNTGMPSRRAASRSTWLVPTEKQPTTISRSAAASTSAVSCVRERMPSMCTPDERPLQRRRHPAPSAAARPRYSRWPRTGGRRSC